MNRPVFLKKGDTLGLVAPSFGATIEPYSTRLAAAIPRFETRGYKVRCADSVYKSDGLGISTDPRSAAEDVMRFYLDDSIDALLSVGGGELMNETISHIDFEALASAKPKWFMGYSDNTNFIMPMATIAGVPGIYGPCATSFGKEWELPERYSFALLEGTEHVVKGYDLFELPWEDPQEKAEADPLAPYRLTEPKILRSFLPDGGKMREAKAEEEIRFSGTVLGGCLDILTNLAGTEFDRVRSFCEQHGRIIWVIEACDLTPMSIRRAMWSLAHNGWFDTAAGFLVGRPLASFRQEMMGVDSYNAVLDIVDGLDVPVIMDCDIGHIAPMVPLVIGADAEACVRGNALRVDFSL